MDEATRKIYEEHGYSRLAQKGQGAETPPEASPYTEETISDFEDRNGYPLTAEMLGFKDNFRVEPQLEMKVRAVDEHIRKTMQDEGLRNSKTGYNTVFNRLASKLGESLEFALQNGEGKQVLERFFMEVSMANRMSSKTYLSHFQKKFAQERVSKLTSQLKDALKALKE